MVTTVKESAKAVKGKTQYYAFCNHSSHGQGWASVMYNTQRPAENAARMHNKMNAGHGAITLTKHK